MDEGGAVQPEARRAGHPDPGAMGAGAVAATGDPSVAPAEPDGAPTSAAPSRRGSILRAAFVIGIMVVVFGIILPNAVDYGEILAAFQGLDTAQILIVTAAGIGAWAVSGQVLTAVIEGLSPFRGVMSWLILSGIGSSIPFGPWNLGVLWVVARGWGISNTAATSGIALYGIINTLSLLVLPVLTAVVLTITGGFTVSFPVAAWVISLALLAVFVIAFGLIIGIVRSERLAERIGRTAQRITDGFLRRLGRDAGPNVHASVMHFRDQIGDVIRTRGLLAIGLGILTHLVWIGVLTISLRVVGIDDSVLTVGHVMLAYTMVFIILIIPISPGGAGLPELMFIGALSAMAGTEYGAQVAAGVFLYRVYFWFIPIPLAWIMLKLARRGKSTLPGTDELRDYARGGAA